VAASTKAPPSRVHPTGQVTVADRPPTITGQGHETTFAQIVSEKLGVAFDDVDIVFGDTDRVQFGMGHLPARDRWSSGGRRALEGERQRWSLKGKKDCRPPASRQASTIIQFRGPGFFSVAGTDRSKNIPGNIAGAAYVPHDYPLEILEPGLEEQAYYDPVNFYLSRRLPHCRS